MYVTDIYNAVMYPSPVLTKPFQSGGWYQLAGYNHVSPFLVFSDVGTRFIYHDQRIRVWYGEDLYNYSEGDNHGRTCFDVFLHFVQGRREVINIGGVPLRFDQIFLIILTF